MCVNRRYRSDQSSCAARGGIRVAEAMENGVRRRRITLATERLCCLGQCTKGPAMRLTPGGEFFLGVTLADVPAMLDRLEREFGTNPRVDETDEPEALPGNLQEPV
jgi:(2Fe-2S) ferredoxin